jgi:hypothetical protein
MSLISFIEDPKVIDKIIGHLVLTFEAERPPPASFCLTGVPDGSRREWRVFLWVLRVVLSLF